MRNKITLQNLKEKFEKAKKEHIRYIGINIYTYYTGYEISIIHNAKFDIKLKKIIQEFDENLYSKDESDLKKEIISCVYGNSPDEVFAKLIW